VISFCPVSGIFSTFAVQIYSMSTIHNFGAGPGILPKTVFEQAAQAVLNFNNSGLSLLEMSHRSKEFVAVVDNAVALVKELLNVPAGYSVLFLQGGASTQFMQVPYNLMKQNGKAAYLKTGVWAAKAEKEARLFGSTAVVATSEGENYTHIPKDYTIPADVDYFHCTSNNTIYGTQMKSYPDSPVTVVCDMSSDIFSKPVDVSKFGLIYCGAQKNMGPAGVTMVIVKDDILGKTGRTLPSMMDYTTHIKENSLFNTPPVFAIYVSMLTLEWVKAQGGVAEMAKRNQAKAELLYTEIDRNPLFKCPNAVEDRSEMNAVFLLEKPELEAAWDAICKEAGLHGLKGHRSVGGYRASLYNALPIESVQVLVETMREFERRNA
jgi:phosphoserine aminotransferase